MEGKEEYINNLLYGKNSTERIVGVEVHEDKATLFKLDENYNTVTEEVPNKFWILSSRPHGSGWVRMKGDLHYKYGKQYRKRKAFTEDRKALRNGDIYSVYNAQEAILVKDGYTYYKGMQPTEVPILSFDIEATGLYHDDDAKVLLISNTFRKNGVITRKLFSYDDYSSQGEMITDWCAWVTTMDPSIVCGHNIYGYDIPYLAFCAARDGVELLLGRDGSALNIAKFERDFRVDGGRSLKYNSSKIYGREIIDTMFLMMRVPMKNYESFGLKYIIDVEGLEVEDRQFYDASQIRFNYTDPDEWVKIKKYAEQDGDDSLALFDKFIGPFFYMGQSIPKAFQKMFESASGSQLNTLMVRGYLQQAHSLPKGDQKEDYEGAISRGNPGIYSNVFKVDVASLYPSIMITYNVYEEKKDPLIHFPVLVKTFTEKRLHHKALKNDSQYHDDMQNAYKILINSFYGFMGAPGLNFNSMRNASFVTEKGRELLTQAIDWSEENGYDLVNCDTDSVSICKPDKSFIDESERVSILESLNTIEGIFWEDDGYYLKFVVFKAKNYVLWDGKKLKTKGSAIKATSKSPAMKEFINTVIDYILNDRNDFSELYHDYVHEIMNIKDISRWASRKTLTQTTYKSTRANETKIIDAIEGTDYKEGDRIFVFYKSDGTLCLKERFDGEYDKARLLGTLWDTSETFKTVLPVTDMFPKYKNKGPRKILKERWGYDV